MDKFVAIKRWNEKNKEKIRKIFLKKWSLDLDMYFPNSEHDLVDRWNEVVNKIFGCDRSYVNFKDLDNFLFETLILHEEKGVVLNAKKQYEFYEPDVWINASLTIRYLEALEKDRIDRECFRREYRDEKWKGEVEERNLKYLPFKEIELPFCEAYKKQLLLGRGLDVFKTGHFEASEESGIKISNKILGETKSLGSQPCIYKILKNIWNINLYGFLGKDVDRWSWYRILKKEIEFKKKFKFEKEIQENIEKKRENRRNISNEELELKIKKYEMEEFRLEDKIMYWRTINGELVRRAIHFFDDVELETNILPLKNIIEICKVEPISWQIMLIEIYRYLNGGYAKYILLPEDDNGDMLAQLSKDLNEIEKFWEDALHEAEGINRRCKLLTLGLIYLYMEGEVSPISQDIRQERFNTIEKAADAFLQEMSTIPDKFTWENVNAYLNGERYDEEVLDDLSIEMLQDLQERGKNESTKRNDKRKKDIKDVVSKIRLQKKEDTLTSHYICLQRIVIEFIRAHYNPAMQDTSEKEKSNQ